MLEDHVRTLDISARGPTQFAYLHDFILCHTGHTNHFLKIDREPKGQSLGLDALMPIVGRNDSAPAW